MAAECHMPNNFKTRREASRGWRTRGQVAWFSRLVDHGPCHPLEEEETIVPQENEMVNIDKRRVYTLVEQAVTPDVMELCSHDARAEVIGRVSMDAFGFDAFAIDPTDDQYDMLNLLDDMVIDVMARRGYELEPGEIACRSIECFQYDGRRYTYWYDTSDLRYVMVFQSTLDGTWHANDIDMTHIIFVGNGDTPQKALDDMRMVRGW